MNNIKFKIKVNYLNFKHRNNNNGGTVNMPKCILSDSEEKKNEYKLLI